MSVTVNGLDEVTDMVEGVAQRAQDPTPALVKSASSLEAFVAQRFATRTAPDGTPWAPLKAHTVRYRETSGELQGSVYAVVEGATIRLGASSDHASYQNASRPFLPESFDSGPAAAEGERLETTLATYIVDGEV